MTEIVSRFDGYATPPVALHAASHTLKSVVGLTALLSRRGKFQLQILPIVRSVSSTDFDCPLRGPLAVVLRGRGTLYCGIRRNIGTRVEARVRCKPWGCRQDFLKKQSPGDMRLKITIQRLHQKGTFA